MAHLFLELRIEGPLASPYFQPSHRLHSHLWRTGSSFICKVDNVVLFIQLNYMRIYEWANKTYIEKYLGK